MTWNFEKKCRTAIFRKIFQVPRRSRVNSKLVRTARNFFVAGLRVHKKKLLGMGTGYQLPPTFCTWGLKVVKIAFCATSGALWRATYYRCGECLPRTLLSGTPATKHWKQITARCTQKLVTRRWICRHGRFAACERVKFLSPTPFIMGPA